MIIILSCESVQQYPFHYFSFIVGLTINTLVRSVILQVIIPQYFLNELPALLLLEHRLTAWLCMFDTNTCLLQLPRDKMSMVVLEC